MMISNRRPAAVTGVTPALLVELGVNVNCGSPYLINGYRHLNDPFVGVDLHL
jgi:hypothetical protein